MTLATMRSQRSPSKPKAWPSATSTLRAIDSRSMARPRKNRVRTVASGIPSAAAVSSTLSSSTARRMKTVRKASEDGMRILRGFPVSELQALVAGAMEPVLKPLVYREPLVLA